NRICYFALANYRAQKMNGTKGKVNFRRSRKAKFKNKPKWNSGMSPGLLVDRILIPRLKALENGLILKIYSVQTAFSD
ncbi:hypothetical protein BaRGS_00038181, partial [Batillaria attramentaria]